MAKSGIRRKGYSVSMDEVSHLRGKMLAQEWGTSFSGMLKFLIAEAWQERNLPGKSETKESVKESVEVATA